jgi:hypothetical protein
MRQGGPIQLCNVNMLTSISRRLSYSLVGLRVAVSNMESKLDIATVVIAVCIATYAAVAMRYVACYDLGFSLEEIRGAAILIAVVIAAAIAIDFFGEKLGQAK